MITTPDDVQNGGSVETDLCIIGSGPAAITIATRLAGSDRRILMLAGGGWKETAAARDLHRGGAFPPGSHEPLDENRRRQFGGATAVWGGRCIPFDAVDFENRPWIPFSGWPIGYEEMLPFFREANAICEAGDFAYDAREVFAKTAPEIVAGVDDDSLVSWPLERWSPPTQFARRYRQTLERAGNISVWLDSHAVHLQLQPDGKRIAAVKATWRNVAFFVRAKNYVLATGGLENARLLLTSRDVAREGIGNHSGKLGRFYMSHLFGVHATARLENPSSMIYSFERDRSGVYCRRRWWLTPKSQRDLHVGNAIAFFFRPGIGTAQHRDPLFSAVYLAKFLLGATRKTRRGNIVAHLRENREALAEHAQVLRKNAFGLVPSLTVLAWRRFFQRRRLPFFLPPQSSGRFHLYYQTEHLPNPDSKVILGPDVDDLGVPRLEAHIRFAGQDFQTVLELHRVMAKRLRDSGTGELEYDEDALREELSANIKNFNSSAHQIGTTRMAASAENGVVDANCRVFGVNNLYVAGASVFPTSGHANPTLTLVALSIRLAHHLKSEGFHAQ